jgi:1,4-dihydroxy-6-naphthoate synthase
MEPLSVAYSPCPNDTYLFYAWQKKIVGKSIPIKPDLMDIQELNKHVLKGKYDLAKCSAITALECQDEYTILPVGAAMGHGVGPLLVAKRDYSPSELQNLKVAIPGKNTVANLLAIGLLPPFKETTYCRYEQVLDLIENDEVDCGVIIHETRFTYVEKGFQLVSDLGELWEARFNLPLPLGVLVAKTSLGQERIDEIIHIIRASIRFSYECPEKAMDYILEHSQEKDLDVVYEHIQTYVNEESMCVSQNGMKALEALRQLKEKNVSTHSICH